MTQTGTRTAAVIGAGFGGLALAIRLQSAGVATTIVEGREKPGGRAYAWEPARRTWRIVLPSSDHSGPSMPTPHSRAPSWRAALR